MKRAIAIFLVLSVFAYGCVQDGKDGTKIAEGSIAKENPPEEVHAEGNYGDTETNYTVPSDYGSTERNIDVLISAANMIGPGHYDELEAAVNTLERNGEDVSALRKKLSMLKTEQNPENDNGAKEKRRTGLLSPRGCQGSGTIKLGAFPIAIEDLQKILPMGMMSSVHITPTDHQYWHTSGYSGPSDDKTNLDRFNIHSPADGFIVEIGKVMGFEDYRIVIEHSCNFYTIFIHIDKLAAKVLSSVKEEDGDITNQAWPRIPVKEGEVIGTVGVGKFDFSVVDENVTLQGFANKKTYEAETWKAHTVDTFAYYKEPLRSRLLEKNVRTAEPLGGRIDYDVDGRLIGNWFRENTNGYKGLGNSNYWKSHLSIVYDALDQDHIVVSIGDFEGEGRQYGVKGNSPKPQDIGAQTGIVKYELVPYDYYSGDHKWDGIELAKNIGAKNADDVRGTALFQLLSDGKLKAEFFPHKKGSQAFGFTNNAQIYER